MVVHLSSLINEDRDTIILTWVSNAKIYDYYICQLLYVRKCEFNLCVFIEFMCFHWTPHNMWRRSRVTSRAQSSSTPVIITPMEPTMEPPTHRDMTSPTTKCRENQIKRLAQRAEAHRVSPPWLNSPHRVMAGITRVITLGDNLYFKVRPSYRPLKFSDGGDSRRLSI